LQRDIGKRKTSQIYKSLQNNGLSEIMMLTAMQLQILRKMHDIYMAEGQVEKIETEIIEGTYGYQIHQMGQETTIGADSESGDSAPAKKYNYLVEHAVLSYTIQNIVTANRVENQPRMLYLIVREITAKKQRLDKVKEIKEYAKRMVDSLESVLSERNRWINQGLEEKIALIQGVGTEGRPKSFMQKVKMD
jgi:hypothetical protein